MAPDSQELTKVSREMLAVLRNTAMILSSTKVYVLRKSIACYRERETERDRERQREREREREVDH